MSGIRTLLGRAVIPALALLTAFLLGGLVIVVTDVDFLGRLGTDPIGGLRIALDRLVTGYAAMFGGALGHLGGVLPALQAGNPREIALAIRPLTESLLGATPLIFVGLGLTISFRAGLINLGVDGQAVLGSLGATVVAVLLDGHLPPPLILVVAIAGGSLAGGGWGALAGVLKARTGAHEVITTLMLNGIAPQIAFYILATGLFGKPLIAIAQIPPLIELRTIRLDWGLPVALVMAVVVSFVLFRTTLGFELRTVGFSRNVARGAGMRPGATMVVGLSLSGGLVGMAAAFVALGPGGGFTGGGVGLVSLALALLGGLRPSGVVAAALLYGALNNGAKSMVIATGIPFAVLTFVIALAVMFVAAPSVIRSIWRIGAGGERRALVTLPPGPPDSMAGA